MNTNRGSPGGGFGSGGSSGGGLGRAPTSGMGGGMSGGASFGRAQQGSGSAMGGRNGDGFQQARSTGIGYGGGGGGRGDPGLMNQQGGGFQQQQQRQGQGRNLFQNLGRLPEGSAQRQQQDGRFPKADAYAMSTPGFGLGYNSGYDGRSYNKYRTLDQESRGFGSPQGPRATFSATDGASQLPPCYNTESRYLKYRTLDGEMNRQAQQVRLQHLQCYVRSSSHVLNYIGF